MVEEVQTSKNLYLILYHSIKEGKRPSIIWKENGIEKNNGQYYLNFLKNRGILVKRGYGVWDILKDLTDLEILKEVEKRSTKKSSIGLMFKSPLKNLHALQIRFPIISGTIKDEDWEIKNKLKNWLPKYKKVDKIGGLTIRNNNNKSITVYVKSRNIEDLNDVDNLAFKIRAYIGEYFKNKHGVILDLFNCETKNINLAIQDKIGEGMIRKGEKFEIDLNKQAEKIFEKDNIPAKAWIDGSPFKFSAETNDKEWAKDYLNMPSSIKEMLQINRVVAKEISQNQIDMAMLLKQIDSNMAYVTKILMKLASDKGNND